MAETCDLFLVRRSNGAVRAIGGHLGLVTEFVAVDESTAYVGEGTDGTNIVAVPFNGDPPRLLAANVGYQAFVAAVDSEHAFGFGHAGMFSLPLGGGQPTPLGPPGAREPLAIDAASVYFNDGSGVARVAKSGGDATPLAPSPDILAPGGIVLDDANAFWADGQVGTISKVAKSGGATMTLVAKGGLPIAVDGSCLYWFDGSGLWSTRK